MAPYDTITQTLDCGVVTLTLNRPMLKNALSKQMMNELTDCLESIRDDEKVRVVVLQGAGENFCSGGDLAGMSAGNDSSPAASRTEMQRVRRMALALRDIDKPVIACVDGVAYGAGFSLVLLADLVLVSDRARLSTAFQRLGLLPDCAALYTLPRIVGLQRARELIYSSRMITAVEAHAMGLALEVLSADRLEARGQELARSLACASPTALALSKRALNSSLDNTLETIMEIEASGQAIALASDYMAEARRRFLAKEPAQFQWPL